tara:strand:+ start:98 stop:640 length:543 start_codon:yes stop_codon:yes gene_type:complete
MIYFKTQHKKTIVVVIIAAVKTKTDAVAFSLFSIFYLLVTATSQQSKSSYVLCSTFFEFILIVNSQQLPFFERNTHHVVSILHPFFQTHAIVVSGYPLPSPESQFHVGLTISVMRGVTFLFGNLIGVLTLRTGRKTMMWSALAIGYLPTFSIFLIGWLSRPTYPPLYAGSKLTVPCAVSL